jgi:signal transduction histidine kinase
MTLIKNRNNLQLVFFFAVLTVIVTAIVIFTWEKLFMHPFYQWLATLYPGEEAARYHIEQRIEHFFISTTVDVIVVTLLLGIVSRQQRRLVEARERLAHNEKIATLGRVAAQVAHEVRNPLSGLLLYSLHLKSKVAGELTADKVELIDKIIETINNLTSTTEQILNYARPVKLEPQAVDLNRVTAKVIQLIESQTSISGIDIRFDPGNSNVAGMLDEASLSSALLNLVLNAVQAMPNGGRLMITTGCDNGILCLVVSDTGSGISEERLKHIFEPFNTTKSRGLGLGMPYAQKIIEQHGGTISVESQLGKGTQVRIELPRGDERKGARRREEGSRARMLTQQDFGS